jgi:hypothetical protein
MSDLMRVRAGRVAPHVGPDESALFRRINDGPAAEVWGRYHELVGRRRAEALSPADHAELVRLTDVVEDYQADRVAALAELAVRRGRTLAELADALGIGPAPRG